MLFISSDAYLTQACLISINYCFPHFKQLALSSDKIATLQMPLLNLHLDVKENGEVKPYSIEMNKDELQNLINSLEAANKVFVLILFCGVKCFDRYQQSHVRKNSQFAVNISFLPDILCQAQKILCYVSLDLDINLIITCNFNYFGA